MTVSSKPTNELYRGTQRDISETEQASMVSFDFDGSVCVRVVCAWEIFYARIPPLSKEITPKRGTKNKGDEVSFEITKPGQYILEINGLHKPLHIFANPKETEVPNLETSNVLSFMPDEKLNFPGNFVGEPKRIPDGKDTIYFGPGVHMPYLIELKSNQSLYIDAGAIVYGAILVEKCTIWGDWGRGVEFGAETSAERMDDVIIRNSDIVHFAFVACDIQACGDAPISDILFENIRIGDPIDPLIHPRLIEIFIRNMLWLKDESLGSVRNITYRNIIYNGLVICPCRFIGQSKEHDISDIHLDKITLNGRLLEDENDLISPIIVNEFANNIYINNKKADKDLCRFETEEDTSGNYLVGNGAFITVALTTNTKGGFKI